MSKPNKPTDVVARASSPQASDLVVQASSLPPRDMLPAGWKPALQEDRAQISRQKFLHRVARGGLMMGLIGTGIAAIHGEREVSECFNHNYCDSCWAFKGCELPEKQQIAQAQPAPAQVVPAPGAPAQVAPARGGLQ